MADGSAWEKPRYGLAHLPHRGRLVRGGDAQALRGPHAMHPGAYPAGDDAQRFNGMVEVHEEKQNNDSR